jgi:APA family basic amino acid/polyamine antiporter
VFVTPRVLFGLARDRLAPPALANVNAGGTPWVAMLLVGGVAIALAATGTFERLISLAIVWILVIDGWAVLALFRLRRREPIAPFSVPLYPWVPLALFGVYGALFVGTAVAQPMLIVQALAVLVGAYGVSWMVEVGRSR